MFDTNLQEDVHGQNFQKNPHHKCVHAQIFVANLCQTTCKPLHVASWQLWDHNDLIVCTILLQEKYQKRMMGTTDHCTTDGSNQLKGNSSSHYIYTTPPRPPMYEDATYIFITPTTPRTYDEATFVHGLLGRTVSLGHKPIASSSLHQYSLTTSPSPTGKGVSQPLYVFFDCETTDSSPLTTDIIEMGAVVAHSDERWNTFSISRTNQQITDAGNVHATACKH